MITKHYKTQKHIIIITQENQNVPGKVRSPGNGLPDFFDYTSFESSAGRLSAFKQTRQKAKKDAHAATTELCAVASAYYTIVRRTAEHNFGVGVLALFCASGRIVSTFS